MFGWRRKKLRGGKKKKQQLQRPDELVIPNHFRCPISLDLMKDPVTLSSGITYDRESIDKWLQEGNFTCPVTNQVLRSFDQIPNHTLRKMIQDWCVENRNHGVERIPTPRIPVTSAEVLEALFNVNASVRRLDGFECLELVNKIKRWGFESERNRLCIVDNGAGGVLAAAFDAFANDLERNCSVLEEILSALNWMFPLDNEAETLLRSKASLQCMVWFLKHKDDITAKQNAILVLKELSFHHQQYAEALENTGAFEILVDFIKVPISRPITKASLMVIFSLVSSPTSNEKTKSSFVQMGLVSLLLNTIIDAEKSICEKALAVLDRLCECEEGREEAYSNALTMPVLVKKIFRVSELATEYSVSTIWKLSKYDKQHEGEVLVEALQVGVFQKLVLLLQCGCGDSTKEKASQLLKVLNPYRTGLECIETADFKNLKRSF